MLFWGLESDIAGPADGARDMSPVAFGDVPHSAELGCSSSCVPLSVGKPSGRTAHILFREVMRLGDSNDEKPWM